MTSEATPAGALRDTVRAGARDLSAIWWWFLALGVLWTLFGGVTQLAVASRVQGWRWLFIVAGIVSVFVAWYLVFFGIMHVVSALAGPKVLWWWTQLLLGIAELVLGVWAVRSYQRSLLTLATLVGVWAIFHGVNEIFAAFSLRQVGKRVEDLVR